MVFPPPEPLLRHHAPDASDRGSRRPGRLVRGLAWLALTVTAALAGAVVRATFSDDATATSTLVIADGSPPDGRPQMLQTMDEQYYRDVDLAQLGNTDPAQWPSILDDPYTHFLTADEYHHFMADELSTAVGVGIDFKVEAAGMTLTRVFPGSPASMAGLVAGDVVIAVDGSPTHGLSGLEATDLVRGEDGSTSDLEVVRGGARLSVPVTRRVASSWLVDAELRVVGGHQVGYVALLDFSVGASGLVRTAVTDLLARGAESIVLDLRGNPGGWAKEAVGVAGVFLPNDSPVLTERSVHFADTTYFTKDIPVSVDVPMAVLLDGGSASSAEIVAGALRDAGRALLVGSTSFGKGRIQDVVVLDSGGAFKFTIGEYLTPAGFALDEVGLTPDIAATDLPGRVDLAYFAAATRIEKPHPTRPSVVQESSD
jgi:C-terminal peptidase prc